jgi:PAS domain S-box-containing protein
LKDTPKQYDRRTPGTVDLLYRILVESVADYAIFALDPEGRIITWNTGAQRLKGYAPEQIIGRHFSIFYPPEDVAADKPGRELRDAVAHGRVEDEGWRVRKDGSRMWANVVITALRDDAGRLIGFAKVTRDLTERRAMEEQRLADARRLAVEEAARVLMEARNQEMQEVLDRIRDQARELERARLVAESANRSKSEFLAAMSHELRTPLNAIGGYIDLLTLGVRGPLTAEQERDLARMRRSQQHLLGIINDLLNFARIEAGEVTYDRTVVAVREVIETAAEVATPLAAARSVSFRADSIDPAVVALADRSKVDQILINLVSNAVKFTTPGGAITLGAREIGGRVAIEVIDTGIGIAADKLETIFEPFVQVGRGLASPGEGTGLGLAISRDLARGMGGDLLVESVPGVGSTFRLVLSSATSR